jgi:hypothetical protein
MIAVQLLYLASKADAESESFDMWIRVSNFERLMNWMSVLEISQLEYA